MRILVAERGRGTGPPHAKTLILIRPSKQRRALHIKKRTNTNYLSCTLPKGRKSVFGVAVTVTDVSVSWRVRWAEVREACSYIHTYIHTFIHTCICMHIHIYICIMYVYIHIKTYIHIYTHKHTKYVYPYRHSKLRIHRAHDQAVIVSLEVARQLHQDRMGACSVRPIQQRRGRRGAGGRSTLGRKRPKCVPAFQTLFGTHAAIHTQPTPVALVPSHARYRTALQKLRRSSVATEKTSDDYQSTTPTQRPPSSVPFLASFQ